MGHLRWPAQRRGRRACLQVGQTGQGRAERKDLEVGAVDELLVGECVVRDRNKGEKNITLLSPSGFCALHFIIDQ